MKLFVDDENLCPKGWHPARDVEEAIRIIAMRDPTDISLDYDAGNGTFRPVAYFIGEKYNNDTFWADKLEVKIHSQNPVGRQNLTKILEYYGIFPTHTGE